MTPGCYTPRMPTLRLRPAPIRMLTLLVLLALLVSCGGEKSGTDAGRVLLIGLDGAEWDLLGPMLEAGELPNLARLRDRGVYGKLRSLEPPQKSPAIWTTIATGKSPEEHGIRAFVDQVGGRPLTKNMRQARALWNIASGVGKTVGVVGWLMTWPAEDVNGFVITDYLQYAAAPSRKFQGRTSPPELEADIQDEVVAWEEVPWSFVQGFLDAPLDTLELSKNLERLFRPIRWIAAGDVTFARLATRLYRESPPDFFAVYLRGMDAMGHLYWNYMTPQAVPAGSLDPEAEPYLPGAMRAYYRYVDELLGPLLDMALEDPRTTVVVCSDHGFGGGPGRGIQVHKLDGVILMGGRGVGKGEITGANVYDVAPTVLVLLGLPPAQDMHGKVLWSALGSDIPRDRFRQLIPTYETGDSTGAGSPLESPVDEELKERLRSLGYID
jgi:predicted AlkP superfamily phosphohydrolase/phosphomutase